MPNVSAELHKFYEEPFWAALSDIPIDLLCAQKIRMKILLVTDGSDLHVI